MSINLESSAIATGLEKVNFYFNPKERQCQRMFKLPYNCIHASKVVLKILQAKLQQYVNWELLDVQTRFRKRQWNKRSNCQHLLDHRKSKGIPEKHHQLFTSGGQSIEASASALPMNIQDWLPLGMTGLILLPKGLSRVFSSPTIIKHQFFSAQSSLWSNSQIHTWPLEKP